MNGQSLKNEVIEHIKTTYGSEPEYPWLKYPENVTFKAKLTGKWFALILPVKRKTLGLNGEETVDLLNVKATPELIGILSGNPGYLAGYHMNKQHWLSIFLDGTVSMSEIEQQIASSYGLVTDTPTARIYRAVQRIPKGTVATYGQIAAMAGDPKMARAVGNALHKNPDPDSIPCYRVVNSKGELSGEFAFGGADVQKRLLEADGIEVRNHCVDLAKYRMKSEEA